MIYEKLNWDSQFFGISISKIAVQNYDIQKIQETVKASFDKNDELIYLIIPSEIDKKLTYKSQFIDNKVVYAKKINTTGIIDSNIRVYENTIVSEELYFLALESGKLSRFKRDKDFSFGSFERLYRLWIERSVSSELADKVFVYKDGNKILGMVTLKLNDGTGEIGLIASSPESQGKGVGSKLLAYCEHYLLSLGINNIEVATQKDNLIACNFYKKNGYSIIKSLNYYHIWNKE